MPTLSGSETRQSEKPPIQHKLVAVSAPDRAKVPELPERTVETSAVVALLLSLCCFLFFLYPDSVAALDRLVPSAAVIVFGGTIIAVIVSFPWRLLTSASRSVYVLIRPTKDPMYLLLKELFGMSELTRRKGLAGKDAAEALDRLQHPSFRRALSLLADGVSSVEITAMIDSEIQSLAEQHRRERAVFETAAGYAPTMGVLASVMSLSSVLKEATDVTLLTAAVSTAFRDTAYGLMLANFLLLPISERLGVYAAEERLCYELLRAGIDGIAVGLHVEHLAIRLEVFATRSQLCRALIASYQRSRSKVSDARILDSQSAVS